MTNTVSCSKSEVLFERAKKLIPGGVNSPARAMKAVDSDPLFIHKADGAYIVSEDGKEFIDYVGSWGPMVVGHRHPRVLEAIEQQLRNGTSYGAPCGHEVELAQLVVDLVPSIEKVRMVNSGTEATMSAVRLARAYTKRDMIVKFDGCYHGHADSLMVKAGSGLATLGISSTPGVPEELAKLTLSIPFNDKDALAKVFEKHGKEIACVIIEPVVGNSGLITPKENYLADVKEICEKHGSLLIFDEVMTGFRVSLGGAQELYDVQPDLTCLGKIIGAGLPVGAYGGKADIMDMVAPAGDVYQAGTLSGNPLAMAAGLAQLKVLKDKKKHTYIKEITETLASGIEEAAKAAKFDATVNQVCGMISVFCTNKEVFDFETASKSDTKLFAKLWKGLLEEGIYWPPSQFEAAFPSSMHSKKDIERTIEAFKKVFKDLS